MVVAASCWDAEDPETQHLIEHVNASGAERSDMGCVIHHSVYNHNKSVETNVDGKPYHYQFLALATSLHI